MGRDSIAESQKKRLAEGKGAAKASDIAKLLGGTSVELDVAYADSIRLKVARYCEKIGGIEKLFAMTDVDRSKSLDVDEFRKLLMSIPAGAEIQLKSVGKDVSVRGLDGKQTTLKPTTKADKEKAISRLEATAVFSYLDEDESNLLEFDEFDAWLRTGGLIRGTNRAVHESYRKPKPNCDDDHHKHHRHRKH